MPSILDLFGELDLKNDSFNRKLKSSVDQMQAADSQLNKVISSSNKLGDTSATVARRYEKLSQGIALQNTRLIESTQAFQSGDIGAKKYAQTLASVETQTRSLASRIADAKARVQELNETNLTHFQQQIAGAVDKSHSLINLNAARPLQGLGPVLQGLGARQFGLDETILNILIVAAREAGIIKVAQEGTAVASAAAAAAETEFAAASRAAATSQGIVAAETEATAAAAAQQTTIFGVGLAKLGAIGAILAIAAGDYYLIKNRVEAINAENEKRLKDETAIAAAINEQANAAGRLAERVKGEQAKRDFDRVLIGPYNLDQIRSNLQSAHDTEAKELAAKIYAKTAELDKAGIKPGAYYTAELNKLIPQGFNQLQKEREDKISELAAKIDEQKNSGPTSIEWYTAAIQKQQDLTKQTDQIAEQEQKKALENAKALAEQYGKEETAALQNKFKVQGALLNLHLKTIGATQATALSATTRLHAAEIDAQIASTRKYFNAIISNSKDSTERARSESEKRIAIANLEAQKQIEAIQKVAQLQSLYSGRFAANLQIGDLRYDAKQFRQGYLDEKGTVSEELQRKLNAILSGVPSIRVPVGTVSGGNGPAGFLFQTILGIGNLSPEDQQALDKQIIEATRGLDPADLTRGQRSLAAAAREREADRLRDEQKAILTELAAAIRSGNIVKIVNEAPDSAKVTKNPTPADVNNRYP